MADVKRYAINWFGELDLVVEIDHDVVTSDMLAEINSFWDDSRSRLRDADGDVLIAILKMLAQRCFQLTTAYGYGIQRLIREFETIEGWPRMDDSHGFKLINCDELEFETCDISVTEVIE
ncbi:hypothetical protein CS369_08270 [Candidatus Symbiopectobacterium sp. 'North America']|uniref:DUF2528 family protein n=1 Tax=Candidatus Symbiopectobacterium sp. 'North America' TaxID=2794574 RepID=UPI0018C9033F|nr:DUF2528 family protein [Candidatus Symbiopectobacterium sp. 'North America']MBG6244764.1 hypothetical protein [Candidatus Symbiopectobacterium sp. 'North America']